MAFTKSILIEGNFQDCVQRLPPIEAIGLDVEHVMEAALYGWGYKEHPDALYDLLAQNLMDGACERMDESVMRETFDAYYQSIRTTQRNVECKLHGQAQTPFGEADYGIIDGVSGADRPFWVLKMFYETA